MHTQAFINSRSFAMLATLREVNNNGNEQSEKDYRLLTDTKR